MAKKLSCIVRGDLPGTGAFFYEKMIAESLHLEQEIDVSFVFQSNFAGAKVKLSKLQSYFYNRLNDYRADVLITSANQLVAGLVPENFSKVVLVAHHYDYPEAPIKFISAAMYLRLRKMIDKIDSFVAVSEATKCDFEKILPGSNFEVIYNSFDVSLYPDSPLAKHERVSAIKEFDLMPDRKIVYLGQPAPGKAQSEIITALEPFSEELQFITSGRGQRVEGAKHFGMLDFNQYIKLLRVSDCSMFFPHIREGWCRSAHEALLCGVPVFGNGAGGMAELLRVSKQKSFQNLGQLVEGFPRLLRGEGFGHVDPTDLKALNQDYFRKSWKDVVMS